MIISTNYFVFEIHLNASNFMHLCDIFYRLLSLIFRVYILNSSNMFFLDSKFIIIDEMIFKSINNIIDDNQSIFDFIEFFVQQLQKHLTSYRDLSLFWFFSYFVRDEIFDHFNVNTIVLRICWWLFRIKRKWFHLKIIFYFFENDEFEIKM